MFCNVLETPGAEAAAKIREQNKAAEKAKSAQQNGNGELTVVCLTPDAGEELKTEVEGLIRERAAAKKAKDFAAADAIRDRLASMGVTLKDGKGTVEWSV